MKYRQKHSPKEKKFKSQPSTAKIMATMLWEARGGVIHVDSLKVGQNQVGELYHNI